MEPACRKDKPKLNSTPTRGDRAKQKSAQQELKQRQRAEVTNFSNWTLPYSPRDFIPVFSYIVSHLLLSLYFINCIYFLHFQIYALNKVMTELEQQQFEAFCKQMQSQGDSWVPASSASLSPSRKNTMYAHYHQHLATHLYFCLIRQSLLFYWMKILTLHNLNMPESIVIMSWSLCRLKAFYVKCVQTESRVAYLLLTHQVNGISCA